MLSMEDRKVRSKLTVLVAVAIGGFVVFGGVAYSTLNALNVNGALYGSIAQQEKLIGNLMPPALNTERARLVVLNAETIEDRSQIEAGLSSLKKLDASFEDAMATYSRQIPEGPIKSTLTNKVYPLGREYFDLAEHEFFPLKLSGQSQKASEYRKNILLPKSEEQTKNTEELANLANQAIQATQKDAADTIRGQTMILLGVGPAVLAAMFIVAWYAVRNIRGPLKSAVDVRVSDVERDVTARRKQDSQNEVSQMHEKVNPGVGKVAAAWQSLPQGAERLASACVETSAPTMQQAAGAGPQNDEAAPVATATQEMLPTASQISQNSHRAADPARQGERIVEQTLARMRGIASLVGDAAKKAEALEKNSDQIGRIIGVIGDIADQTNLLARNAAMEATRAAERGRGVAVVADEVRKLAEQTSTATKEIASVATKEIGSMIQSIQGQTKIAVDAMETGTKPLQAGVETMKPASFLNENVQSAGPAGETVPHLVTPAAEQLASTQGNANIEQIPEITATTA